MKITDVVAYVTLAAMLIGGGIWLGRLQQQVDYQNRREVYEHGSYRLPAEAK